MASTASRTPSLTPSRSPTPEPPVQPDHFYGNDMQLPPSPSTDGRTWLDPKDDPLAQRGIPVFKPTMDEFRDFEAYMNRVECWGSRSGIVKIIPPKEWTDALPPVNPQLAHVKLKNPIEQQMMGHGGLFRQQNIEKRKVMSVREWAELCSKEELRAPGVDDVGLHARSTNGTVKVKTRRGRRKTRESETAEPEMTPDVMVKEEEEDGEDLGISVSRVVDEQPASKPLVSHPDTIVVDSTPIVPDVEATPVDVNTRPSATPSAAPSGSHTSRPPTPGAAEASEIKDNTDNVEGHPQPKRRRKPQTREAREAALAERAEKDKLFLDDFDPHVDWLPPNTSRFDYTPEFCKDLERRYWRNCGLGKPAWYGADMQGSLFTDETTEWNVAHLKSTLSRLLPASSKGLPGVNTPYLYFGMWRATFAWHVEDMDLFSINYIHFGAPKFWYAVPQARAGALEQTMKGYFPKDISQCPQFLRHKAYLASPKVLTQSSCRPNFLVQQEGEFVITYPRGYHAGFNLGFNCAESVNFALDSWMDKGRVARVCECVDFSVRIDVDQLLRDREAERMGAEAAPDGESAEEVKPELLDGTVPKQKSPRKRKSNTTDGAPRPKKPRTKPPKSENAAGPSSPSKPPKVTLKLGPKPQESDVFPCCLCVSSDQHGLLRVHNPPLWQKGGQSGDGPEGSGEWKAHEECANVIPETWIDEIEVGALPDGTMAKERMVFGTDAIPKDRWNLKCNACSKTRHRAHGAPIQCTKGKCPKAYHVSCARNGADSGISYQVLREVENDVLLNEPPLSATDDNLVTGEEVAPRVLSLVKKLEVQVLCPQHNPVMLEAKKTAKQDKIRNMLLALPSMTRIKLRVSAGVFEVSLIRVIEETGCVEVLWDRGHKREFKWSSVVFGNSDNVVGQKPSELAPEPDRTLVVAPSHIASKPQPASTSFFLPLGSSGSMEVRASLTQSSQHYATPPASSMASTSSSAYAQPYQSPYYQPYGSTSQPQGSYWSSQYPGSHYMVPPSSYSTAPSGAPPTYGYSTGHYPYHYSAASYPRNPQQQPAGPQLSYTQQPTGHPAAPQAAHPHYATPQAAPYTQYAAGSYTQYPPAQSQPYPQVSSSQRPAYTSMAYQGSREQSYTSDVYTERSHSQTPSSSQAPSHELRWQRPYEGPKEADGSSVAKASRSASRSSSTQIASRAGSKVPAALPNQYAPHEPAPEGFSSYPAAYSPLPP